MSGRRESPASLEDLYESHYRRMVAVAALLVDDVETAEEIVQDAFLALHRRWGEGIANPGGYLRTSVVNGARDVLRHRSVRRRTLIPAERDTAPVFQELDDVLSRLPLKERTAIVLRYSEDLPEDEIAAALGVRPSSVRSLIHRGLKRLRTEVER